MDAVRGVGEYCDQSVVSYSAGTNRDYNKEMRHMNQPENI